MGSVKKGVLGNFTKFTGKHLCQSLFFNEVAGLRPATLLKKRLWYRCFPVNFAKFLRTLFLQSTSGRLLLPQLENYSACNSQTPKSQTCKSQANTLEALQFRLCVQRHMKIVFWIMLIP